METAGTDRRGVLEGMSQESFHSRDFSKAGSFGAACLVEADLGLILPERARSPAPIADSEDAFSRY